MGFVREWAQQAAGTPPQGYAPQVVYPWMAMAFNINPAETHDTTFWGSQYDDFFGHGATFNTMDLIFEASSQAGGSPYENVTAFDPDSLLQDVVTALQQFRSAVDDYDPESITQDVMATARTEAATMFPASSVDAAVAAFDESTKAGHLREISRTLSGAWEAGAILSTQVFGAIANLGEARTRQINEYRAKLNLQRNSEFTTAVLQIAGMMIQAEGTRLNAWQAYTVVAMDRAKLHVTAKQDQRDKDLEFLTRHITWDLDLMQYGYNALGAIYGAQVVPRSQTKGERLLSLISGSASMGIQGGMAMGSPQAGIGMGALNLVASGLLL